MPLILIWAPDRQGEQIIGTDAITVRQVCDYDELESQTAVPGLQQQGYQMCRPFIYVTPFLYKADLDDVAEIILMKKFSP